MGDTSGHEQLDKEELMALCVLTPHVADVLGFPEPLRKSTVALEDVENWFQALNPNSDGGVSLEDFYDWASQNHVERQRRDSIQLVAVHDSEFDVQHSELVQVEVRARTGN